MKYFRIFWVEKYNRSLEPWMPVQPSLPPRIVTNTCRRARNAQPHLRLLRRFSSCDVQSFHSFWPFGSNDTMFLTTWLFHNSEPKVGLVIKDFFKWFLSQSFIKKPKFNIKQQQKSLTIFQVPQRSALPGWIPAKPSPSTQAKLLVRLDHLAGDGIDLQGGIGLLPRCHW